VRQIFILGFVSFFVDVSTEMVYPLIPVFLTAVIGANVSVLGLIEGLAESLASLLKVFSGHFSDRIQKRKILAIFGYGFSWAGKIFFVLAGSWQHIFTGRMIDRIGKGIRTAPRDALIADYSDREKRGFAYGVHRAMDTLGAFTGVLAVIIILSKMGNHSSDAALYKRIFAISIIPLYMSIASTSAFVSSSRNSFKLLPTSIGAGLVVGVPPRYHSLSAIFSACFISVTAVCLNWSCTAIPLTPIT